MSDFRQENFFPTVVFWCYYTKREKRMLRIVRAIKRLYKKCAFEKKDDLHPKKWYESHSRTTPDS
ncbi:MULTISPECIES: hypothetical protein [unclassified Okeania]|uniref:hypothetical protein n=1 Tax=unclassified Okeania TaxID=2634635 RepID=UPI0013C13541|nr:MULTISPECIES: hypothetical protein [unclassified Okeania]NET45042.1 hypothetical protein [Okeania sp. SIO2B3]